MGTTSDPNDPGLSNIKPDGMQETYLVLSEEERRAGFVRPVLRGYVHTGEGGQDDAVGTGLRVMPPGCGQQTVMGQAIAETYARDPKFYQDTYCATCKAHFPVAQFVWTGTNVVVGS